MMKQSFKNIRAQLIFIIAVIVAWEVMTKTGMVNQLTFPSISAIGKAFVRGFTEEGMAAYIL